MTTTDTTREAPLATRHPWFLDLYAELLTNPATAARHIAARLASADVSDPIESALALYLTALCAQHSGDDSPLREARSIAKSSPAASSANSPPPRTAPSTPGSSPCGPPRCARPTTSSAARPIPASSAGSRTTSTPGTSAPAA